MKIKKALKIIGIILLIIITIFLIHTLRNFIIVSKLQNNIAKYKESTNYHISIITNEQNGIIMSTNYYKKDDKEVNIIERNMNGEIARISIYNNNGKKDFFAENSNEKKAKLDTDALGLNVQIYNSLESDSRWNTLISSIFAHITSSNVNGINCYVVSNYPSFIELMPLGKNVYYIDKDNGLLIKTVFNEQTAVRKYEFDNVDDSVFIEPDISQYTIDEN